MKQVISDVINEHQRIIELLHEQSDVILRIAHIWRNALKNGNKILFCGNGGSASDCQHLSAELVGRFVKERRGMPGIALTTDTSILTAVGNDYGFDRIFSRQVEALGCPGDVLVGISTSGNSANVLNAMKQANEQGLITVGLSGGTGGRLAEVADECLTVVSSTTARIQEAHILVGHILCQLCDEV